MSAKITVRAATLSDKAVIANLNQKYMYELSQFDGRHVGSDGSFAFGFLDAQWFDERRHPYLMHVGGELVGFALVHSYPGVPDGRATDFTLSALFVMYPWRRLGVGRATLEWLTTWHPGTWQVSCARYNVGCLWFLAHALAQQNSLVERVDYLATDASPVPWCTFFFGPSVWSDGPWADAAKQVVTVAVHPTTGAPVMWPVGDPVPDEVDEETPDESDADSVASRPHAQAEGQEQADHVVGVADVEEPVDEQVEETSEGQAEGQVEESSEGGTSHIEEPVGDEAVTPPVEESVQDEGDTDQATGPTDTPADKDDAPATVEALGDAATSPDEDHLHHEDDDRSEDHVPHEEDHRSEDHLPHEDDHRSEEHLHPEDDHRSGDHVPHEDDHHPEGHVPHEDQSGAEAPGTYPDHTATDGAEASEPAPDPDHPEASGERLTYREWMLKRDEAARLAQAGNDGYVTHQGYGAREGFLTHQGYVTTQSHLTHGGRLPHADQHLHTGSASPHDSPEHRTHPDALDVRAERHTQDAPETAPTPGPGQQNQQAHQGPTAEHHPALPPDMRMEPPAIPPQPPRFSEQEIALLIHRTQTVRFHVTRSSGYEIMDVDVFMDQVESFLKGDLTETSLADMRDFLKQSRFHITRRHGYLVTDVDNFVDQLLEEVS